MPLWPEGNQQPSGEIYFGLLLYQRLKDLELLSFGDRIYFGDTFQSDHACDATLVLRKSLEGRIHVRNMQLDAALTLVFERNAAIVK